MSNFVYWWERCIVEDEICHYCSCVLIKRRPETPEDTPFFVRDGGRFVLRDGFGEFSIDHKIPRAKGGSNRRENLVSCCMTCNLRKSTKDYQVFKKQAKNNPLRYTLDQLAAFDPHPERNIGQPYRVPRVPRPCLTRQQLREREDRLNKADW